MAEAFDYCAAVLVILSGVLEGFVLHLTNTAKHAALVFLTSKCLAPLLGGSCLLARCIATTSGVHGTTACSLIISGTYAMGFSYLAHTVLAYIDLYMSLERMAINDPPITKTKAVIMSVVTWVVGFGISALGFRFENPDWSGEMNDCRRYLLVHLPGYTITAQCVIAALIALLFGMYRATDKLLRDSITNNHVHNAQAEAARTKTAKYLEDRRRVLKILAIKTWIMIICWGVATVMGIVLQLCETCRGQQWIGAASNLLQVFPIFVGGWIYIFTSKRLSQACGSLCCRS